MYSILLSSTLYIVSIVEVHGFTVDIVNITECRSSEREVGELVWDIGSEESADQLFSGTFKLPEKLNEETLVDYESHFWDEGREDWIFIFGGIRSFCDSVLRSLPYQKFQNAVEPNWPETCPIPAGKYELQSFPISGQYAVLSDIRNVPPLAKHEIKLWGETNLLFCRIVYTLSSN